MSIQPDRPMLSALRDMLRKLECEDAPETAEVANLKRILSRRIAEIESVQRGTGTCSGSEATN